MTVKKKNKKSKDKDQGGRPTDYKSEYCEMVYKLCLLFGAKDKEIAEIFGVTERTLNNWKEKYPEFFQSLKKGKEPADAEVAKSLFHRALGYNHEDVDIRVVKGKIVKTKLMKYYPPDSTAAIFWLKNRQPKKWRDSHELTGKNGGPIETNTTIKAEDLSDDELAAIAARGRIKCPPEKEKSAKKPAGLRKGNRHTRKAGK